MVNLHRGPPDTLSQLPQSSQTTQTQPIIMSEEGDGVPQGSSSLHRDRSRERQRDSTISQSHTLVPSRGGTLKKRRSLSRKGSLRRDGSRKGSRPGSVTGLGLDGQEELVREAGDPMHSAFYTPVSTSGSPTEILATRFQGWLRRCARF